VDTQTNEMIKPSDLRLGNWLYIPMVNMMGQVTSIGQEEIRIGNGPCDGKGLRYDFSNDIVQSIPLTEEWLVRFGFTKEKPGSHTYEKGLLSVYCNDSLGTNLFVVSLKPYPDSKPLRAPFFDYTHVHQLQNLFFALTGDELLINQTSQ